uniref:Uncharacterized protein n=1 Tax=Anguilla anguilla TaxID=7936 RepID=A0A0E9T8X0_ANGAN
MLPSWLHPGQGKTSSNVK